MFGPYLREHRERLKEERGRNFSLRQVALRIGIEPAYLSKIENGKVPPPSEEIIFKCAVEIEVNPNELMARAGKLPEIVSSAFNDNPTLVAELADLINKQPSPTPISLKTLFETYKNGDDNSSEPFQNKTTFIEPKLSPALWGKEEARRLLRKEGFKVEDNQHSPNSNSLLVTKEGKSFTVWPKTSQAVRQVRLGTRNFLNKRGRNDFYFGFLPQKEVHHVEEGFDLFIVRGDIAKEDGLIIDDAWLAKPKKDGTPRKPSVIIVKDVDRQPHRKIWDKWTGRFLDGWEWLP